MTFANVIKILVLVATIASLIAPLFEAISPSVSAIVAGVGAGILAFTSKIQVSTPASESTVEKVN